jgi:hypothetical protein
MAVPVAAQISANAFTIVPSDTTIITANGVYVGGAGNVTVRPAEQEGKPSPVDVTFSAVPVGTILPIQVSRVFSTGTTATLMVAFGST